MYYSFAEEHSTGLPCETTAPHFPAAVSSVAAITGSSRTVTVHSYGLWVMINSLLCKTRETLEVTSAKSPYGLMMMLATFTPHIKNWARAAHATVTWHFHAVSRSQPQRFCFSVALRFLAVIPFRPHFSRCRFTSSRESPVLSLTLK